MKNWEEVFRKTFLMPMYNNPDLEMVPGDVRESVWYVLDNYMTDNERKRIYANFRDSDHAPDIYTERGYGSIFAKIVESGHAFSILMYGKEYYEQLWDTDPELLPLSDLCLPNELYRKLNSHFCFRRRAYRPTIMDLNRLTGKELLSISGVGITRAREIIRYLEEQGFDVSNKVLPDDDD